MRILAVLFVGCMGSVVADGPMLRVHEGHIQVNDIGSYQTIRNFRIEREYTFEIYLEETLKYDYMVESCYMNDREIIGQYGCVQCGQCIDKSIETESYNKPGAIKRTLVHFRAQATHITFKCNIRKIHCSGCAERSCQRHPSIELSHFVSESVTVMYPADGYSGNFPMPIPPPHVYPTPFFGRSSYEIPQMPPNGHGGIGAAPPSAMGGSNSSGLWPWWVWLLILLLLLLLLCCLLALCLAAWLRKRKAMKKKETVVTTTAIGDTRECGIGTEKASVHCVGTDTKDIVKIQPAMVLGAEELHQTNSRSKSEHEEQSIAGGGGSYSLREGHIHEGYTRTIPNEHYHDRFSSRDRYDQQLVRGDREGRWTDRSSYRNFAYERDMGRVEPLDGYDEVETREKTYCLSDDEGEIVEKDVKRTHTTRFVQETREYDGQDERYRGDEHHHAHYTHSLPV